MYVSMKKILERANKENYAVMAINCFNLETARTVIKAAELEKAPIIVNIFQEHFEKHSDSELITPIVKTLAERASVEVALNF
ncbi:class II fructose-bisphosphate aldolase, partial [Terrisporobacter sp.]|uniref:class II fructose-bisphosphate aldolase n=1 Tax=Terrisporobacter sp. TaxID=1965305 RepID=UPI00261CBCB6